MPGVWLWNITVHLSGALPMGSSADIGQGGVQGGLGSSEGQDPTFAARGGLQTMNIRDDG
jgi:hypothetical protein